MPSESFDNEKAGTGPAAFGSNTAYRVRNNSIMY
jgi:hypothetical protein